MRCFYHPEVDAVGSCRQCGKTACHECISDVGGAMLCRSCIELHQQYVAIDAQQAEAVRQAEVNSAKNRILWSWIVAGLGALFGIAAAIASVANAANQDPGAPPLPVALILSPVAIIFAAYLFWSHYWGIPVVWHWWKSLTSNAGCFILANPILLIFLIACFFYIPLVIAGQYGFFGGAIYQYLKYRKIASS